MSPSPLPPPLLVVAAALTDRAGRVLVQRRPTGQHHAGLWEFPGGKVDEGETPVEALVRELGEELAIAVDDADCRPLAFATSPSLPGGRMLVLLLYRVTRWRGVPRALAADAAAWHRPEHLTALAMPPADRDLSQRI